jgi:hypothetical protein
MDTWYANTFAEPEVVLVKSFSGQFVIGPLGGENEGDPDLWITVSLDHVRVCSFCTLCRNLMFSQRVAKNRIEALAMRTCRQNELINICLCFTC